jgi:hypothetical protein
MTRLIIISSFFLAMVSMISFKAFAGNTKTTVVKTHSNKRVKPKENSTPFPVSKTTPKVPAAKTVPPEPVEEKNHGSKTDELPHIHHFHKERVKKVKRHHKKVWTISMLILVLCHISILIMAYMHVTPH